MSVYIKILFSFLKIGLFSFGGGNAMLPLVRQEVVIRNHWLSASEFTDMVAISQATPGPIAINSATYAGYRAGGLLGSIIGTFGMIFPTFVIIILLTKFYMKFKEDKYVKDAFSWLVPATVGLVAAAAILIGFDAFIDYKSIIIFLCVFIAAYKYKADPILLTILSGIAGYIIYR